MKKIVITGAAGFLGSHLAKSLVFQGKYVVGIDNFSTGKSDRLKELLKSPNFKLIEIDVTSREILDHEILKDISEIYHLASPASPIFYQSCPLETIAVNTIGTKQLLDIAKREGARFVFSSTSEIYGDPEVHPQPESYRGNVTTWGPRACYDESKRLGEVYCFEYHRQFGLKTKVARLFNTYSAGLRNDDGRVISTLVTQALKGQNLTVYGDGNQTRSFCYVDDTINGLILLMENERTAGEIINLGNPTEYTINEVAQLIIKLTGTTSKIVFHPLPIDDPKKRRPDISKAERLLNWRPHIDLEEGLKRTISHYRASMNEREII